MSIREELAAIRVLVEKMSREVEFLNARESERARVEDNEANERAKQSGVPY